jgi:2-keto-3-deoxygluconate permease
MVHDMTTATRTSTRSSARADTRPVPAKEQPTMPVPEAPERHGARQRAAAVVTRLPAASVLLPLAAGSALATWTPGVLRLGPFTHAASTGGSTCIVLLLIAVGAQLQIAILRPVASRVAIILAGATLLPGAGVVAYGLAFGRPGVAGVPLLSVAAAGMCTSNGLWISLAHRYGSTADATSGALASILNSGPLAPLIALDLAQRRGVAATGKPLVDALLPLLVGAVAGAAWPPARKALQPVIPAAIVLLSFALGTSISLNHVVRQVPDGLLLAAAVCAVSGGLVAAGWAALLHQQAALGFAASAITLAAPAVPGMIAWSDPTWRPDVAVATAQVSIAMIASTLTAPLLVSLCSRRQQRQAGDRRAATGHGLDSDPSHL